MHKKIVKNISDIIYYDDWLDSWRDFVQDWKDRLKRIDTLLHKIKTSWLVEKYIKLTWNHSMILYKKKKHYWTEIIKALFNKDNWVELELSGHFNFSDWPYDKTAYWDADTFQSSKNGVSSSFNHKWSWKNIFDRSIYEKPISKIETKLRNKIKKAEVIWRIKKWIMNIFSEIR